jgi:type IV secretory pathway VirB2 component (pilin)
MGGGLLQTAVQWFYQNFALGIVMAAVFFAGILLMAGRIGWVLAVGICAGAVVIGNYATIASSLMGAGG